MNQGAEICLNARPAWQVLLIGVVAGLLLMPGTPSLPLLDRDEPRFARAAVEMMERGEWIIPYFNDEYRFDKPVMTYWLMRGSYQLLGVNELGARFHSIVSTLLIALCAYAMGMRLFSRRAGLAAALGLLTCLQFLINGRSCVADMPMVLAVCLAMAAMYELLQRTGRPYPWHWFFVLYGSLAFGFLVKGPIAWLVPGLSLVLLRWAFWRRPIPSGMLKAHLGIPLALLLTALWGVPALLETGGAFWDVGIQEHVLDRGARVWNGRLYSPLFYLATAFVSLFPWLPFADKGLAAIRGQWGFANAYLVSWLLAPYLVFTFYATQLPHYVMPGFPAFFLLLGQVVDVPAETRGYGRAWFWASLAIPVAVGVFAAYMTVWPDLPASMKGLQKAFGGLASLLLGLGLTALLVRYGAKGLAWTPLLAACVGISLLAGGLRQVSPVVQMTAIFRKMPAEAEYIGYQFTEGSLVFYSGRPWTLTDDAGVLQRRLAKPGSRLAVILESEKKLDEVLWQKAAGKQIGGEEAASGKVGPALPEAASGYAEACVQGLNFGNFKWIRLRLLYRPHDGKDAAWIGSQQPDAKMDTPVPFSGRRRPAAAAFPQRLNKGIFFGKDRLAID
jgi:4-amino-4-deoxy-L-arabinose transferase-like glycosyltransferase